MSQRPDPNTAPSPASASGITAMSDWAPASNAAPTPFDAEVDEVLHQTAALARALVGAHQGAAALIVRGDWQGMRKYFSLSPKYAAWFAYRTPAVGFGVRHRGEQTPADARLARRAIDRARWAQLRLAPTLR